MKNKIIAIIAICVIALTYYFAIYKTTDEKITSLNSCIQNVRDEIEVENSDYLKISEMAEEIAEGKMSGSMIYDYDNTTAELSFLSSVVSSATNYNINFDDAITNDGLYVRRGVTITFTCPNYTIAKDILLNINNCPYRTIFKNVTIVPVSNTSNLSPSLSNGSEVSVQASLVFIELCSGNEAGLKTEGGVSNE